MRAIRQSSSPINRRTWLVAVFALLAFAQTLAYYVYLRDDPGNYNGAGAQGDQVAYIGLAQQLLQGGWSGAMHYMPGLPMVIAATQLVFGDPRLGIAVVQGLLFALMVVYAARVAGSAFGESTSPWAAAAVGLNPSIGYYAAQALTEFLTGMVLLLMIGAIYAWSRKPGWRTAVAVGVLIGLAAYLRAEYLALAGVFALIFLWLRGRSAARDALVVLAVTALVISPWVAR